MKKIHYPFLALFAMFFISSSTIKSPEPKPLYEKIIFVEVSVDTDSVLFQPYSAAWDESWSLSDENSLYGAPTINYDNYQSAFENHYENLYTILHPMMIKGTIRTYYPMDPEAYGTGHSDDGEMRFPIGNEAENQSFLTSEEVRNEFSYLLGEFGPISDMPLVDEWGDNVIITLPDGTQSFKYADPDYIWYTDKNIVKYKLRVSLMINAKGKVKKRIIRAICPVANRIDMDGGTEDSGKEEELLWLNFEALKPALEKVHCITEKKKSVSYLDYFLEKVQNVDVSGK